MNKQEVLTLIDRKLAVAHNEMLECVALSEEHGVMFSLPWGGEGSYQRGMGADYVPESASDETKRWALNNPPYTGWQPSAGTC
jgi:hypothetical protein